LLNAWACVKNVSGAALDHPLLKEVTRLLNNSEFHDSSQDFKKMPFIFETWHFKETSNPDMARM
jgi:hypothetical protein